MTFAFRLSLALLLLALCLLISLLDGTESSGLLLLLHALQPNIYKTAVVLGLMLIIPWHRLAPKVILPLMLVFAAIWLRLLIPLGMTGEQAKLSSDIRIANISLTENAMLYLKPADITRHNIDILSLSGYNVQAVNELIVPLKETYPYQALVPDAPQRPIALLSKYPINLDFELPQRQGISYLVELPEGMLRVIQMNTQSLAHASLSPTHAETFSALGQRRSGLPTLIIGQLNTPPHSVHVQGLLQSLDLQLPPRVVPTWPAGLPLTTLNPILVPKNYFISYSYAFHLLGMGERGLAVDVVPSSQLPQQF